MSIVDDYLSNLPDARKATLQHVADLVKEVVPEAVECTSYNMPAFRYKGKVFLGFLAWKSHLALYPFSGSVTEALRDKLQGFKISAGSGAIHFSEDERLPDDLIREIIALRLKLIA